MIQVLDAKMVSLLMILPMVGLAANAVGYFTLPSGMQMLLESMINLSEKGPVYGLFKDPPFKTKGEFWFYEVKNPRDVLKGKKMILGLKGPYYASAGIYRTNVSFQKSNEILDYNSHRRLELVEEGSADLDERFYVVNPILPSVQAQVKEIVIDRVPFQRISEPIVFNSISVALDMYKERYLSKTSARELLEGRLVELLEVVTNLADRFGLKSLIPPGVPDNKFGLLHAQNSLVEPLKVWTGLGTSQKKFGEVYSWRGNQKMKQWTGKCNDISGGNGELYKPFLKEGKPIPVFFPPLCRSFTLEPAQNGTVRVQNGLMAYKYQFSPKIFKGAQNNSGNLCYCTNPRVYDCHYDGLLRMAPCFFGAPLYFAVPNFNGLNRRIRSLFDDSKINQTLPDDLNLYLDPYSGAVVKVNISLAGLVKVLKQPYLRDLSQVQNITYAPFFATNESLELPFGFTLPVLILQLFLGNHKILNVTMMILCSSLIVYRIARPKKEDPVSPEPTTTTTGPAPSGGSDEREREADP